MKKVNIIFLDFDGVLNSEQSHVYYHRHVKSTSIFDTHFCPIAMSNLNYIFENVKNTKIVISSSWRKGSNLNKLKKLLSDNGFLFPELIIDVTPAFDSGYRADEIIEWLDNYGPKKINKVFILDDDRDMYGIMENLIQIDSSIGLTIKDAKYIVGILSDGYTYKGD